VICDWASQQKEPHEDEQGHDPPTPDGHRGRPTHTAGSAQCPSASNESDRCELESTWCQRRCDQEDLRYLSVEPVLSRPEDPDCERDEGEPKESGADPAGYL
jgi:hypothetical protein